MTNIAFPEASGYRAGESIIVGPKGEILAKDPSVDQDGIIEATIPIAAFRANRKLPNYAYEMTKPVLDQYVQEFPLNHLDMPREMLPETGQDMKSMMESISRYNAASAQPD